MYFLIICLLQFCTFYAKANDVLGCGGFIKSHVPIDFSKVEIKLYTKQGILKDKTNCAPNNGYYFIPVYDKGDYVLQLEPPPGWSFTPTKFPLSVDGKSDLCSQGKDINFVFKGFGITGKVESYGRSGVGPAGVQVELNSQGDLRTSVTSENGNFFFTPVYPGQYTVSISHPKWNIMKKSVSVTVTEGNTELPPNSLVVGGYDVSGYIKSEKEPVAGASIILFHSSDDKTNTPYVDGCDKTPIAEFKSKNKYLCHVTSNSAGNFVFPTVSPGKYNVMPFYKSSGVYFQPSNIEFTVKTGSVELPNNFQITGFTLNGKVLSAKYGDPLKATIYLDGQEKVITKSDGTFILDGIKTGKYVLQVKSGDFQFNELEIKVNPSTLNLPDIIPSAYKVCGEVVSDKPQIIKIVKVGTMEEYTITTDVQTGYFCQHLSVGKYQISVTVDDDEYLKGVQFFPLSHTIDVGTRPISGITFSQLKAEISGRVNCIKAQDCDSVKVILRYLNNDIPQPEKDIISDLNAGNYVFDDVRPGTYEILLTSNRFCWKKDKLSITVTNATLIVPPFEQTGFSVIFISSHEAKVSYRNPGEEALNTVDIPRDRSSHCVSKPGLYKFILEGCHSYDPNTVTYNTDFEENEIYLVAQKHKHTIQIRSPKDSKDVFVTATIAGSKTVEGPLKYKGDSYYFELSLAPNENAVLLPQSETLYFNPPILSINGKEDCVDLGKIFSAVNGKVFKGRIIPPLSGVEMRVESESSEVLIHHTNEEGKYQFAPLDASKSYRIKASKDSYILVGPNENGDFIAHKLAEIVVEVLDEINNVPLQGALLSLSGGESYRSNLQTNENGKITFHSLSPSQYFLRPMLKEYNFEPNSKIIDVKEGATVHVQLRGKRVAYSAFGQVTSLSGDPEENMIMVARGVGNCSQYSEEATSETSGNFRIRGLIPYCSYEIALKGTANEKDIIERSSPSVVPAASVTTDIKNLLFTVFRPVANTDIVVKVYSPVVEYYKSLRLKLSRESAPAGLVHSLKLDVASIKISDDQNTGVFVHLPSIPFDGKSYSVQLESTISHYNTLKPTIHYFVANSSFKYISLEFVVKPNQTEQQIKQTSIWTLLFIFAVLVGIYNLDFIVQFLKERYSNFNLNSVIPSFRNKSPVRDYAVDQMEIDQIVENINKRKVKPRKL